MWLKNRSPDSYYPSSMNPNLSAFSIPYQPLCPKYKFIYIQKSIVASVILN